MANKHSIHSSYREKLLEHLFIAELLKRSWCDGDCSMEIAKPEVDSKGYDIIAEIDGVVRHIQLKATARGAQSAVQDVHVDLALKPSGCIIWMIFDEETLELGPFLFFGAGPREPLPSLEGMAIARHTKANAQGEKLERPNIRKVKKGAFEVCHTFDALYQRLFHSG